MCIVFELLFILIKFLRTSLFFSKGHNWVFIRSVNLAQTDLGMLELDSLTQKLMKRCITHEGIAKIVETMSNEGYGGHLGRHLGLRALCKKLPRLST